MDNENVEGEGLLSVVANKKLSFTDFVLCIPLKNQVQTDGHYGQADRSTKQ